MREILVDHFMREILYTYSIQGPSTSAGLLRTTVLLLNCFTNVERYSSNIRLHLLIEKCRIYFLYIEWKFLFMKKWDYRILKSHVKRYICKVLRIYYLP